VDSVLAVAIVANRLSCLLSIEPGDRARRQVSISYDQFTVRFDLV
jgi:hypothetical protein